MAFIPMLTLLIIMKLLALLIYRYVQAAGIKCILSFSH